MLTKKEGAKVIVWRKKNHQDLIKDIFMNLRYLMMYKDNFTIMKTEPFGPLIPILQFKDFDDVVKRANNNDLGLASYIYTKILKKRIELLNSWKPEQ